MKNINHLIDMAGQSHQHMPALLSLLVGLISLKRESALFSDSDNAIGDNIPTTLMDDVRK